MIVGIFLKEDLHNILLPFLVGTAEVEKCMCILQSSCVNVHSIEGKDYIASLPFQVNEYFLFLYLVGDCC